MADRVSVIVPVLDREHLIGQSIDSLLAQQHRPHEIIVVDDGSSDSTLEILGGYGDAITVLHTDHAGPAGARNRGIAAASGDLIAFLDSDDLMPPAALADMVAALRASGADAVWGLMSIQVMPGGRLPASNWVEGLSRRIGLSSLMIRADALRDIGGLDEGLRFGEDSDLMMRIRAAGLRLCQIDAVVVIYRRHAGNMTNDWDPAAKAVFDVARNALRRRRAGEGPKVAARGA
jgi:glycosyltransferase involved in cell wall biosynthesis